MSINNKNILFIDTPIIHRNENNDNIIRWKWVWLVWAKKNANESQYKNKHIHPKITKKRRQTHKYENS